MSADRDGIRTLLEFIGIVTVAAAVIVGAAWAVFWLVTR